LSDQEDSKPSVRAPNDAPDVQNKRSDSAQADAIRDLQNKFQKSQDALRKSQDKIDDQFGKLQDADARFARLEENQAVALIAAIRVAFFASSFGSLSWGIALSVDIPVDAGWLYYSAIVFFFVASVVFFVLGFIFKITWLEPLRKIIAPVVNWLKRRRRRRD